MSSTTVSEKTDDNICGIHVDFLNNRVLSFQECEAKIDKRIQKYKHVPLTLHGKDVICNAMLFPLLFYAAATYLPAKSFFENINKRVLFFIWGEGKSQLISRKVIRTHWEKGVLGLYDVSVKTKAIYFQSNFMTPCVEGFSHQRISFFLYFFGFRGRRLLPILYDINYPHTFQPAKNYKFVNGILKEGSP